MRTQKTKRKVELNESQDPQKKKKISAESLAQKNISIVPYTTALSKKKEVSAITSEEWNRRGGIQLNNDDLRIMDQIVFIEAEDQIVDVYGICKKEGPNKFRVFVEKNLVQGQSFDRTPIEGTWKWSNLWLDPAGKIPSSFAKWIIGKVKKGENAGTYFKALEHVNGQRVGGSFVPLKKEVYKRLKKNFSVGKAEDDYEEPAPEGYCWKDPGPEYDDQHVD